MRPLDVMGEAVGCTVEVGLSGVPFTEELVYYVRRCCERAEEGIADRLRWTVRVERDDSRPDACVDVRALGRDGRELQATAADLDELLAVRNAFAVLTERF